MHICFRTSVVGIRYRSSSPEDENNIGGNKEGENTRTKGNEKMVGRKKEKKKREDICLEMVSIIELCSAICKYYIL